MSSLGRTSRLPPSSSSSSSSSSTSLSSSTSSGIGVVSHNSHVRSNSSNSNNGVSVRSKSQSRTRSVTPNSRTRSLPDNHDPESERVRVAVRLRPRNSEEISDPDYVDCVELQPELNRLKLRKNNWSSEAYRFDEVFTESASQKRVYEAVAKPVVESVLDGYNGTIMAYGQTGTGKTYTLGRLGKEDASERGIMIRSMEDILAGTSASDNVEMSYLQLYMESVQDLLAPEKINIPIAEDVKTGEVSVPGAEIVKIRDIDHFLQLLQLGEANRHAANTKLNSESSRSHAILMVYVRRTAHEKKHNGVNIEKDASKDRRDQQVPVIWKSKLLIVDLAGSERVAKSGSEGHLLEEAKFINLSLTSLGKCINALAENSPYIPTRDSKLTRLLRDSFGGSARTSLIITIGPSYSHHAETASTIMFGQRATKILTTVKLKEEFDYESLCRKLQTQIDHLSAEIDRHQKLRENDKKETEKELEELQMSFTEAENRYVARSKLLREENDSLTLEIKALLQELDNQKQQSNLLLKEIAQLEESMKDKNLLEDENSRLSLELKGVQEDLKIQKDENKIMQNEVARLKQIKQYQLEEATFQKILADTTRTYEEKISDLMKQIEETNLRYCGAEEDKDRLQKQVNDIQMLMQKNQVENAGYHEALTNTTKMYEEKIKALSQQLKDEKDHARALEEEIESTQELLREYQSSYETKAEKEIDELQMSLEEMHQMHETVANELRLLSIEYKNLELEKETLEDEFHDMRQKLQVEERRRKEAENELHNIMKIVPEAESEDGFEEKKSYTTLSRVASALKDIQSSHRSGRSREAILSQRSMITKLCEEVGLQKIIPLLQSGDLDVQIQAVKIVANLAAEDANQEKIVQEGGLDALLMLIDTSQNTTILRVASGAIANLAMSETNQGLISNQGGAKLLANAASKTDDPQTLRMIAGAIANLCGNEKLHMVLKEDGAIKALLRMARLGNADVTAQVARALANFAKCESRIIMKGHWRGRSLLIDEGGAALTWLVANLSNDACTSARRHMELAFCHLAQNEDNARDLISSGGLSKLIEISDESAREDIQNLAKKILRSSPLFRGELHAHK